MFLHDSVHTREKPFLTLTLLLLRSSVQNTPHNETHVKVHLELPLTFSTSPASHTHTDTVVLCKVGFPLTVNLSFQAEVFGHSSTKPLSCRAMDPKALRAAAGSARKNEAFKAGGRKRT